MRRNRAEGELIMLRYWLSCALLVGCSGGEFRGVLSAGSEGGEAGAQPGPAAGSVAGPEAGTAGSEAGAEGGLGSGTAGETSPGGSGSSRGGAAGAGLTEGTGGGTSPGGTGGGTAGLGQGGEAPETGGQSSTGGVTATGGQSSTGGVTATGGQSSTGGVTATGGQSSTGGAAGVGGAVVDPDGGMILEVIYLALNPDRDWDPDEGISRPDPFICMECEGLSACSGTSMDSPASPWLWMFGESGVAFLVYEGDRVNIEVYDDDGEDQPAEYAASTTLNLSAIGQLPHEMRIMFGDVERMDLRLSVPPEGASVR